MSDNPWHRRYHSDALTGMLSLTLEERGAYQTVLDMIYDRGGPIADHDRVLAGYMGCSVRKGRSLREKLIASGKLTARNGVITNRRAEKELENDAKTSRKHAENGAKGGRVSAKSRENPKNLNQNNGGGQAPLKPGSSLIPEARSQSIPLSNDNGPAADPSKVFWDGASGYLGDRNRGLIGRWAKEHGQAVVAEAITEAMLVTPQPADRAAYVGGILRKVRKTASAGEIW